MALVLEQIHTEGLGDASYLIGDDSAGVAALIDPLADVDRYLQLARARQLAITHVFQTHVHEDFASGATALARQLGGATIGVSGHDAPAYGYAHQAVHDGDRFAFGGTVLTARHTPGHTPEHIAFLIAPKDAPDEPFAVLSGGSLLAGAAGRSDLLGPDHSQALARAQFRTLRAFFLKLSDGVVVYPTHVHGSPCGASIGERNSTTIGHERRHNPLLQIEDEQAFVRHALGGLPPKPSYYPRLKETNTRGDEIPTPAAKPLPPPAFEAALQQRGAVVIDTRDQLAFGGGHIDGAIHIGGRPTLSTWAGWLLDVEQPLLLVLDRDEALSTMLRYFQRTGFHRISGYLAGGISAWRNAGRPLRNLTQLSVQQLARELGSWTPLDVRSPAEWDKGHLPGARHVYLPELPQRLDQLDRHRNYAVYCGTGYRASIGASLLQRQGFEHVASVPGSWSAWQAENLPVER